MRGISRIAALLLALVACSVTPVFAQPKSPPAQPAEPKPAQIDRNGVLILIRSTLLALHQANETGNYTVLRDLAAPNFRDANTAARLAEIFANQRAQKLDLSGVAALEPQLTLMPQIEPNGLLHMAGLFPSVPSQVNFELLFAPVDGRWKVFGISVNVGSSTPVAPMPPAQPHAAPASPPKVENKAQPKPEVRRQEPAKAKPKGEGNTERPAAGVAEPAQPGAAN